MNIRKAKKLMMKKIIKDAFINLEDIRFTTIGKGNSVKMLWKCNDAIFGEIYKILTFNTRKNGTFDIVEEDRVIVNDGELGAFYSECKDGVLMKKEWKKYRVATYKIV